MEDCVQFTQMPLEIQVMILEDLTAKDFARLSAISKGWQEVLSLDLLWRTLGYRRFGQYVGEIPTKAELEEFSAEVGEKITHVHWLQHRAIFGRYSRLLQLRCAVEKYRLCDYTPFLRNTIHHSQNGYFESRIFRSSNVKDIYAVADSWRTFITIDFSNAVGVVVATVKFPVIKLTQLNEPFRCNIDGQVFKVKIRATPFCSQLLSTISFYDSAHLPTQMFSRATRGLPAPFKEGIVGISRKSTIMAKLFWDDNIWLLSPFTTLFRHGNSYFTYKVDELCDYVTTMAENFSGVEPLQMQLCLAEIVSGVEYLHKNNILLGDVVPAMKKDGHLQFIVAKEGLGRSHFGAAPEIDQNGVIKPLLRRADFYFLGAFMLCIATGSGLHSQRSVPDHLPLALRTLLASLLAEKEAPRPKNIRAVKGSPYFDGINWSKMAQQDWTPKFRALRM